MQITRIIVLAVAVLAGGAAAYLALNLTQPEPVETALGTPMVSSTEVLVANRDITVGTSLAPGMVTWREWPQTGLSSRFITRSGNSGAVDKISEAIARATFFEGEPITEGKLIRTDSGFMSAILPAGKRAVATVIAADTSAGGFILFNAAAKRLPLSTLGFFQYIAPSITFGVAVTAFGEPFERVQMIAFACVWVALVMFSLDSLRASRADPTGAD